MSDIKSLETYVSSIKIKGLHFLPPVITNKRRIELQRYKQQAVKLERRLQTCRDLKKNLQELLVYRPFSEYQSSESNSVVETESYVEKKSVIALHELRRKPVLSHDLIDITEYGKDGIKIIDVKLGQIDNSKCNYNSLNLEHNNVQDVTNLYQKNTLKSPPTETCDILESVDMDLSGIQSIIKPSSNSIGSNNLDNTTSPPPRLIRSNSYILENPSPVLLANLDKLKQVDQNLTKSANDINIDTSAFVDNNYIPFENSQFNSLNTVCDTMDIENTGQSSNIDSHLRQPEESSSPKIEVIQTDISVQHITVDCNKNLCDELDMQKSSLELIDPNCQLIEVLKSIPEDYSRKILHLIEKQQIEHSKKNYGNNDNNLEDSNWFSTNNNYSDFDPLLEPQKTLSSSISELNKNEKNTDKSSISPSQSIYYTLSSTCTVLPSSPMEIIDLDTENTHHKIDTLNSTDIEPKYFPIDSRHQQMEICRRKLSFRQERLNKLDAEITSIKQDWAASVIGAYVKGYLTRRLLRTERVQALINTIKDALICALQLHSADNIDESDVELHRRLINQVTAACYTFHDIFFSTSVAERMSIISTDRRRLLERAKRPASAPVSRPNRSSTKLRPRTSLSQSVTNI